MTQKSKFMVKNILNNNVVVAVDKNARQEMVIISKGIGFKSRSSKTIELEEYEINKSYITYQSDLQQEFSQLLNQLDSEVMGLSEEIIAKAK